MSHDTVLKIIIVGDAYTGKTCLARRYVESRYDTTSATVGIDFQVKNVELDGKKYKVQLWDTGGQERYGSVTNLYFRHARGVVLVYDISNRGSFENIITWHNKMIIHGPLFAQDVILVGAKCDLPQRKVSYKEGALLAAKYHIPFIETSAKDDIRIDALFETLLKNMVKSIGDRDCVDLKSANASYRCCN